MTHAQPHPNPHLTDRLYRFIWREEPVPTPADLAAFARDLLEEIHRLSADAADQIDAPVPSAQLPLIEGD